MTSRASNPSIGWPTLAGAVLAVALAAAVGLKAWLAVRYHQFETVGAEPRYDCTRTFGVTKPEDINVDWKARRAFVSATSGSITAPPGILRLDLPKAETLGGVPTLINVTPTNLPIVLKPHGLSLYTAPNGEQTLFVVNHAAPGSQVLLFDVTPAGTLSLRSIVREPGLYSPNAVVGTSPTRFYVTNSTKTSFARLWSSPIQTLKLLLGFDDSGNIAYYDGHGLHTVAKGLLLANGVALSVDGATLVATETLGQRVSVYRRDTATNALTLIDRIPLPGAPDNINLAPDGSFFAAVSPHPLDLFAYTRGASRTRPATEVVRLSVQDGRLRPRVLWRDNGSEVAAISTGVPYARSSRGFDLLFGNISPDDHFVLACVHR